MNRSWWQEAVVYQVYPRSFMDANGDGIGDLPGILQKLDYIKELGADVIWLCPVYQSPNDDNGYDISDYQSIMSDFGTMEDFDRLLSAAHERGLKIVMDLVVNHTSDEHQWFVESRKSRDNPYRDYYIWRPAHDGHEPNEWQSYFSGPAWKYDETTGEYYLHLFSAKQPDLNWDNSVVRDDVFRMMKWWLDKGIDGFRMDVISLISKRAEDLAGETVADSGSVANGPHVHDYLREMNERVLSHYDIMTVGETPGVTVEEARKYTGFDAHELNMVFQFELMDVDSSSESGKWNDNRFQLSEIKRILTKWQKGLDGVAWNSLFWNNHDQPRAVSRFGDTSSPLFWEKSAKMLATCMHMLQGTPYIYQGEELGMTNVEFQSIQDCRDIESINAYRELVEEKKRFTSEQMMRYIRKSGRDNARTPMQWDNTENAGFSTGTPWLPVNLNYLRINAAAERQDPESIFAYYQKLIRLRKEYDIIVYGHYDLILDDHEDIYAYIRSLDNQTLWVLCNFSSREQQVDIPELQDAMRLIGNYHDSAPGCLRAYEAQVYLKK